jgi:cytochrome P450
LLRRLKSELRTISSEDPDGKTSLLKLEKLAFLTAVLKEGLRLGYGPTVRSARIAPDTSLKCGDFTIPPGTPVSMTVPLTHHDESIFPDSHSFNPDRWLAPNASHLDKYLVAFSKGSRACVGINLALAELYLCIGNIFGKFGTKEAQDEGDMGMLELHDTDEDDVRMASIRITAFKRGLGVVGYLHLVDHLAASKEVVGSIPAALKLPYYFIQK